MAFSAIEVYSAYYSFTTNHNHMSKKFVNASKDIVKASAIKKNTAVIGFFGDDERALVANKDGKLLAMTAVCPHAGCTVGFNAKKKTLDCPCHGSRFELDGKLIQGPAQEPLSAIKVAVKNDEITEK